MVQIVSVLAPEDNSKGQDDFVSRTGGLKALDEAGQVASFVPRSPQP